MQTGVNQANRITSLSLFRFNEEKFVLQSMKKFYFFFKHCPKNLLFFFLILKNKLAHEKQLRNVKQYISNIKHFFSLF